MKLSRLNLQFLISSLVNLDKNNTHQAISHLTHQMRARLRYIAIGLTIALTGACSSSYSISTNVDKEKFKEYLSPSKVVIYSDETEIDGHYRFLGAVDGESCQLKPHHEVANKIDARTDARSKAFQLGANAIVFTSCTLIETQTNDKQCVTTRVCYGKAYKVNH